METLPLLKCLLRDGLVFLGVPDQHLRLILDPGALAKRLDHGSRAVQ